MSRHPASPLMLLLFWSGSFVFAPAQEGAVPVREAPAEEATPLTFRRIFVPKSEKALREELTRGMIPIPLVDFEETIRRINRQQGRAAEEAQLSRAEYSARFSGIHLVDGRASLAIVKQEDAPLPELVLHELGLAVGSASWEGEGAGASPARLALNEKGEVVVPLEGAGPLRFEWTLRGEPDHAGGAAFLLSLPACPSNRLRLDVPAGFDVVVDDSDFSPSELPRPAAPGYRTWSMELGGRRQVRLRIVDQSLLDQKPVVRESHRYDLSVEGTHLDAEFRLDAAEQRIDSLLLLVDEGVVVSAATLNGNPLAGMRETANGGSRQIEFPLPQPVTGAGHRLVISAEAPPATEERKPLPRVRLNDVDWQSGEWTLNVLPPLLLSSLEAVDCSQSRMAGIAGSAGGESRSFRLHRESAELRVAATVTRPELVVIAGTTIEVDPAALRARIIADLSAERGPRFSATAQIGEGWSIDAVESDPPEALGEVRMATGQENRSQIHLELNRPAGPAAAVRLILHAHHSLPAAQSEFPLAALQAIDFQSAVRKRSFISIPPASFSFIGTGSLPIVDVAAEPIAELLDVRPPNVVLFADSGGGANTLTFNPERPRYDADVECLATLRDGQLEESYRLRCRPAASRLGRVLVHFSRSREEELVWSVVGESERSVIARRLTAQQQMLLGLPEGETWELALRRASEIPFEVVAARRVQGGNEWHVSLPSAPEAETQQGEVLVAAGKGAEITLEAQELSPAPLPPAAWDETSPLRARYRYAPGTAATLMARLSDPSLPATACAWDCRVDIKCGLSETAYSVLYKLENAGRDEVSLRLPAGAVFRGAALDDRDVGTGRMAGGNLVVPLQPDRRFAVLRVDYFEPRTALSAYGDFEPRIPSIDVPVLTMRGVTWLPPGYQAGSPSAFDPHEDDWAVRLLGRRPWWKGGAELRTWLPWVDFPARPSAAASRAKAVFSRLARNGQQSGEGLDWRALVVSYQQTANATSGLPGLLVHEEGLAQIGITPQTPVEGDVFAASNALPLVFIAAEDDILLTSTPGLAFFAGGVEATDDPDIARFQPGHDISQWTVRCGGVMPAESWGGRRGIASPWRAHAPEATAPDSIAGWSAVGWQALDDRPPHIAVRHPLTWAALGWGMLFVAAALAGWLTWRRPWWLILTAGVMAGAALLLPGPVAALAGGAFWGTILAVFPVALLRWRKMAQSPPESASTVSTRELAVGRAVATLLLACLSGAALLCTVRDGQAIAQPQGETIHTVILAVDEDGKPDKYVYLSPEFDAELNRRSKMLVPARGRWRIHGARYEARVDWRSGERLDISELRCIYDVDLLDESAVVSLPLNREDAHFLAERASLDGRPLETRFDAAAGLVEAQIAGRGPHRLEFVWQPTLVTDRGITSFSIQIPPVPRSHVQLDFPAEVRGVELLSARGEVKSSAGRIDAELGPASRLAVAWPTDGPRGSPLRVEEWLWMRLRPTAVTLDARWRFSRKDGPIHRLTLIADSRLELLPFAPDSPVEGEPVRRGEIININLKTQAEGEVTIDLRFRLSGAVGIGRVAVPRLAAVADEVVRRSLAVSSAAGLDIRMEPASGAKEIPPQQVAAAMDAPDAPALAFEVPSRGADSVVFAAPPGPLVLAQASTSLICSPDSVRVEYAALLDIQNSAAYQFRFQTPPGLAVERIALRQGDAPRAARFIQADSESFTMFLSQPISGDCEIELAGTLPLTRGRTALPQIVLEDVTLSSSRFDLYQTEAVSGTIDQMRGLERVESAPLGEFVPNRGRLAASLSAEEAATIGGRLRVAANRPQVAAQTVTRLEREPEGWTAEFVALFQTKGGRLDTIVLETGPDWSEPFYVEPAAELEITSVPGSSKRRLTIRPSQPLAGSFSFRLSGKLMSGAAVAVPRIQPLGITAVERFVAVPATLQRQEINWKAVGGQESRLPPELSELVELPDDTLVWQASTRFRASIEAVKSESGAVAEVLLADARVIQPGGKRYFLSCSFDLEPAGKEEFILAIPAGLDLLFARVGDHPAILSRLGKSRFSIQTHSRLLPQRLELLFAGSHDEGDPDGAVIQMPDLEGVPVKRRLWTLHGSSADWQAADAEPSSSRQLEMTRLEALDDLIFRSVDVAAEQDQRDVGDWYLPWARRYSAARRRVASAEPPPDAISAERLAVADAHQGEAAVWLGVEFEQRQATADSQQAASPLEEMELRSGEAAYYANVATGNRLKIRQNAESKGAPHRIWAAMILALVTVVLLVIGANGRVAGWLDASPLTAAGLLGAVWLLALPVPWIGLIILAIAATAAAARKRRRRQWTHMAARATAAR